MEYRFVRPLDVLYLRGNRLFGAPGEHAEAVMPPWPSLAAGALRSRMLVDHRVDVARFAAGESLNGSLGRVLGTPSAPGSFRLGLMAVARKTSQTVEIFFPPPADLFVAADRGAIQASLLRPLSVDTLAPLALSAPLSSVPVLRTPRPAKGTAEYWLTTRGVERYLAGELPVAEDFLPRHELWSTESRLGIALSASTRTAESTRLYTSDAVVMRDGTGFLVGVHGADGLVPGDGLLRLGGDGRGATIETVAVQGPWMRVPGGQRFRMVLSTPGLFPSGWSPLPVADRNSPPVLRLDGCEARLVAAAVPRAHVVSGWDLARGRPKPAQKVVPAGAVYWFEIIRGDASALAPLLEHGLWPLLESSGQLSSLDTETRALYEQRRAEGFNNVWLGQWSLTS